jgi:hypothetical protein
MLDAFLFSSASDFTGGHGGDNLHASGLSGGNGGHGIDLTGPVVESHLLECDCAGGSGGGSLPGGAPGLDGLPVSGDPASWEEMPGKARVMELPIPIREHQAITIDFRGEPDELAIILISYNVDSKFIPELGGQWLLDLTMVPFIQPMGKVPASGHLAFPMTIPEIGCGFT